MFLNRKEEQMKRSKKTAYLNTAIGVISSVVVAVMSSTASAEDRSTASAEDRPTARAGDRLPTYDELRAGLQTVVGSSVNGGAGLNFWGVVVDRDGIVRAVAFSGRERNAQLPIGRIVTTLKASTANNLSLNNFLVSTPQLSQAVLANGVFQNLPDAYPINPVAFRGPPTLFGTPRDPMVGHAIGGATSLGGGLALYNDKREIIGSLGIGGEVHPCADHNAAWILRHRLGLDNLPAGIGFSPTGDDNIIYDLDSRGVSASGFGTAECTPEASAISRSLPVKYPVRRR